MPKDVVPVGWIKVISRRDPNNPIPYYFNETTGKSVWNIADIPVEKQTILTTIEEEPTGEGLQTKESESETKKIVV